MRKKHVYESIPLDSQGRANYQNSEQETWSFLLKRQKELVATRASIEYLKGLEILNFKELIPQHFEVSEILNQPFVAIGSRVFFPSPISP